MATVGEDSGLNRIDVLANDRDLDAGDTITVVSVDTSRALGRVVLNSDGTLSYSPDGKFEAMHSGQTATDTFSYTIRDRAGLTSTATVTVTIQGNNDGPVAVSDFTTVVADGSVTIAPLANDTDPDAGDRFTLMSLDTQGMLGSASIAAATRSSTRRARPSGRLAPARARPTPSATRCMTAASGAIRWWAPDS